MSVVVMSITVVGILLAALAGYLAVARVGRSVRARSAFLAARLTEMRDGLDRSVTAVGAFVVLAAAVMTLVTGLMYAIGHVARQLQPLDWAIYHWVAAQQTPGVVGAMRTLTQVGNKHECWTIALICAVLHAVLARRRRWAGLLVIAAAVVLQHYQQVALAEMIHRGHPPHSGGTFPSGGAARTVVIYGACAFALLRVCGASRRIWAIVYAVVAAVAFFEGWSRLVLNAHWLTDVLSGWLSGLLLLACLGFAAWPLVVARNDSATRSATVARSVTIAE